MTGIEVDSLCHRMSAGNPKGYTSQSDLHIVAGEELGKFRLGGRISEIPNVQSSTFSSTGSSGVSGCGVVFDAGLLQVISEIVDGRGHCG